MVFISVPLYVLVLRRRAAVLRGGTTTRASLTASCNPDTVSRLNSQNQSNR